MNKIKLQFEAARMVRRKNSIFGKTQGYRLRNRRLNCMIPNNYTENFCFGVHYSIYLAAKLYIFQIAKAKDYFDLRHSFITLRY